MIQKRQKKIKIISAIILMVCLIFGGFYFYSGIKSIEKIDNKWLVNYRSPKIAGAQTEANGVGNPANTRNTATTSAKNSSSASSQSAANTIANAQTNNYSTPAPSATPQLPTPPPDEYPNLDVFEKNLLTTIRTRYYYRGVLLRSDIDPLICHYNELSYSRDQKYQEYEEFLIAFYGNDWQTVKKLLSDIASYRCY
jgi:flagellar basal body-associated protein FliL